MEDLNKNQIVLLTLLVSFVTSIATGIMTFTLLQEAPIEVTRTINQVVEKTIERVIPGNVLTPSEPSKTEVTTVVVTEEDSVVDSISKNEAGIVRIREKDVLLGTSQFYGMGVVIDKNGIIAADRKLTLNQSDTYIAVFQDGKELTLSLIGANASTNFVLFKVITATSSPSDFSAVTLSNAEPKLGQTVISIGGYSANSISVGRINSFDTKDTTVGTTTTKYISSVDTTVDNRDLIDGSPLFNLSGDLIGMKLADDSSRIFTPIAILQKEMSALTGDSKNQ